MSTWKSNRKLAFLLVFITYVVASVIGVIVFGAFNLPVWLSLLIADVASTAAVFVVSLIVKNSSVYDPYWSVQPIVILTLFAAKVGLTWSDRKSVV